MKGKKTLVLGASGNTARYSNLALKRLKAGGHPVVAIGRRPVQVDGINILTTKEHFDDVDTVTLYLNRLHQAEYHDYILSLRPKRIIFNPGAENPDLASSAKKQGIQTLEACTLVMLSTNQY